MTMLSLDLFAQDGTQGITLASQMLYSYFEPLTRLILIVGAICGLVGSVKVFQRFSSGDPATEKAAAAWFGACIFLVVSSYVLKSFFLT